MPPPATHDRKFLVVRTDRLGDVLLTLPMISRLRAQRPDAGISMLVRRYPGELLAGHPHVDDLVWYDTPGGVPVPFAALLTRLREARYDAAIVVHPTPRLAWLVFRAGIPVRIGTGYRYYSPLFNRRVYEHRRKGDRHEAECNLGLLAPLGIPARADEKSGAAGLTIPDSTGRAAREKLSGAGIRPEGSFVVIHPGSGGSARDWPAEGFAALGRRLLEEGRNVLITGSEAERELVNLVAVGAGKGACAAAGLFTLHELAAVLAQASLFVGNSSGPLHLAVAMGTPVVGLYPQLPEIGPRRWGPYTHRARVLVPDKPGDCTECRGPGRKRCVCMESIAVDTVYRACMDLIRNGAPASQEVPS